MKLNLCHILFFSLLFSGATTSYAGGIDKGYEALKVHDYFKAKKHFTKGLKYNSSAASQGLAVIYFRTDNPFHNYDSAYRYINKSIEGWDMAKQRKKDKWAQYGYTKDSLFSFRKTISTEFYKIANELKTEAALSEFIAKHPWADEKSRAITTRDSIAFFNAVKANNTMSYKAFADKYPQSTYADLARENYYDSQYYEETSAGTLDSYVEFIQTNSESPMKPQAEKQVFSIVTQPNNAGAFNSFIETYPENQFIDTAWFQLYQYELSNYSVETIEGFLNTDVPFKNRIRKDLELFDSITLPYVQSSKYGFMNVAGKQMISNKFDYAGFFQEGLAVVVMNDKYGFVNKHGEVQIQCIYQSASDFNDGRAIVELNGKFGMIDRNGRFFFNCIYDDLGIFSDSLVYASKKDIYGYYNFDGQEVIPHNYNDAYDFHNGVAKVEKGGKHAYINTKGNYIVPPVYSEVKPFYDTLYIFYDDGFYGVMNHRAQIFVEPIYSAISSVHNGLAVASIQNRVVYLDTLGTMVIDNGYQPYPNFLLKGAFMDGIAIASKKDKYGRINIKDEVVTEFEFENIGSGTDLFPAQKGGKWGVFNSDGEIQIEPSYASIVLADNGCFIASRNDTAGVINPNGEIVVPFSFNEIESVANDLFLVTQNKKVGIYINEKLVIPVQYDQIGVFDEDFLFLSKGGELLYYNISSGTLVELTE